MTSSAYAITMFLNSSPFREISNRIGCHEAALRLIFSLVMAYPIVIFYNLFLIKCSIQRKHHFFLTCGFAIGLLNYGINILHTLTTIITVHTVLRIFRGNIKSVVISFCFCSAYLLWGYYKTLSEEYAFEWTIPQCVLTLRLIAVSFDVYDGIGSKNQQKKEKQNHYCSKIRRDGTESKVHHDPDHQPDPRAVILQPQEENHVRKAPSSSSPALASNPPASSSSSASLLKSEGRGTSALPQQEEDADGNKNAEALNDVPSLLQILAHCYFPASFLVGPQFGLKIYLDFVKEEKSFLSRSLKEGIDRLLLGVLYMAAFQIGSTVFPHTYLITPDFRDQPFLWKIVLMTIITKIQLCKYICIWLISEGSCVVSGVTYDKESDSFDKCSNVCVLDYETTSTFGGLIRSFNVTTNHWSGKYIFKRLKFLRSKLLSHLCTLVYLALWHGWKSGYYVTFTIEFLIMKMEWEVTNVIAIMRKKSTSFDQLLSAFYVYWPLRIFFRIYTLVVFGYCLIPFILLSYAKWIDVLAQFYFFGHLIYVPYTIISPFLLPAIHRFLNRDSETKKKK